MNNSLRKELRTNLATNPFNDKFNSSALNTVIQKHAPENAFLVTLFESYHHCFKAHFAILKDFLATAGHKRSQLIGLIINFANHHYLCMLQEQMRKHKVGDIGRFFSETTKYTSQRIGIRDITGVSETVVDTVMSLINFISKFEYKEMVEDTIPLKEDLDNVRLMIRSQSYLELLKLAYETPVWRNAGYKIRDEQLFIQFENEMDLQCFEVAQYRMQQKVFDHFTRLRLGLENRRSELFYTYPTLAKGKSVEIKRLINVDGFLRTELDSANAIPVPQNYLKFTSAIELYYPFLHNVVLPDSRDLRLYDLLYQYSLLQEIFEELVFNHLSEDYSSRLNFGHISDKVTQDELEYYFLKRTTYSLQQIHFFLKLMGQPLQGRINFWDSAMFMQGCYFQVMYNPLLTTVSFHLMDTLLEKCGIDLDFRGKAFERYIKEELSATLTAKRYYHQIAPSKIEVKQGKGVEIQEIDLLLFLQDTILIAEVKCIKYPMETRDRHNSERILSKASRQVITKKGFLERNYAAIINQLEIDNRPRSIVPVIITNYPTATGLKPGGIPVIDLSLISLYFNESKIATKRMTASPEDLTEEVVNTTMLYNNEQEFSQNLFNYCYDNPVIKGYLSKTRTSYYLVANKELLGKELFNQYCCVDFAAESL